MKNWDRTTIGAGFDSSMNLSLPIKTRTAGKVALDAAGAAEGRFRTVNFDLQRRILQAANLPAPRPVAADDASLIAVTRNPELASLAQRVAGRTDAVELARLAYLPDIIRSASITGSISQSLGAMLMVPPSGYSDINVNQAVQQRIGVTVGRVEQTPLTMSIRAVGIVRPDETRVAHVH
jgi:hypothetical protein